MKWILCSTILAAINGVVSPARGAEYHITKEISTPWADGWDTAAMNGMETRLYLVRGSQIDAVDLTKETFAGGITNASDIRGFTLAPQYRRAFFCNGHDSKIEVVDSSRLKMLPAIKTPKVPRTVLFGPGQAALYAINQDDQSISIFEADDGDYVGTVKLPGKPGIAVADDKYNRVYCVIEDKNELAVIDGGKKQVIGEWNILPKEGVSAMTVDSMRQRIFLGCRNQSVMMVDSVKGVVYGAIGVEGTVDDLVMDRLRQRLLVSAGGSLTIAIEYTSTELKALQTLELKKGPLLISYDPKTRKIYLSPAKSGVQDNAVTNGSNASKNIVVCEQ